MPTCPEYLLFGGPGAWSYAPIDDTTCNGVSGIYSWTGFDPIPDDDLGCDSPYCGQGESAATAEPSLATAGETPPLALPLRKAIDFGVLSTPPFYSSDGQGGPSKKFDLKFSHGLRPSSAHGMCHCACYVTTIEYTGKEFVMRIGFEAKGDPADLKGDTGTVTVGGAQNTLAAPIRHLVKVKVTDSKHPEWQRGDYWIHTVKQETDIDSWKLFRDW